MTDFDDRWLDVDFTQEAPYTFGDLGAQTFGWPSFEERFGTLSEAEIREAIAHMDAHGGSLDLLVTRIFDQRQEGSCVANATGQAHQLAQAVMLGVDRVVQVSAISLYKRIGRTASSGAFVSDGWKELNRRGILPLDTPENRERFGEHVMPNTGFNVPFPAGWESTGIQFAGIEAWNINTMAGLESALCKRFPVVVGREGHSICYCRPMRDSRGRRIHKYVNSWSEDWGENGFGFDSEAKIQQAARYAFALRAVRTPGV